MNEPLALILVAEDDPYLAYLVCQELRRIGAGEVYHVLEGRAALARLTQEPRTAILITDLHMPLMDGFALIEAVRAEPGLGPLHILVYSASEDPADQQRCRRLQANGFLRKSLPLPELRARLREVIAPVLPLQAAEATDCLMAMDYTAIPNVLA